MKIKSIQTKFMILIIAGIVSVMLFSGSICIYTLITATRNDSIKIINLTCGEKVQEMNIVFENIEKSVGILAQYAVDKLDDTGVFIADDMDLSEYMADVEELGHTIVTETEGAVAVYVRLNPQYFSQKDGFFTIFNYETGEYEREELTDLSLYEEDDMEHVGWYYLPVKMGHAVWMLPYYNSNVDVQMISYVTPLSGN